MKELRYIILFILLLTSVSDSYSQFYDVKMPKKIMSVGTCDESASPPVTPVQQPVPTPSESPEKMDKDTTSQILMYPPLDTLIVTSPYGYRNDPFTGKRKFHGGTDYRTCSENVYSMMHGRIKKIGYDKKLGNYVTLDHGNFTVTYAHLHTVIGEKGDNVFPGQSIGISGSTGRSTGEHLHVSIRYLGDPVDPDPLIRAVRDVYLAGNRPNPTPTGQP